jgi:hypothetical protein
MQKKAIGSGAGTRRNRGRIAPNDANTSRGSGASTSRGIEDPYDACTIRGRGAPDHAEMKRGSRSCLTLAKNDKLRSCR